jgi:hypothetical protein
MLRKLDRYLDDELSDEQRLEFESRLGEDPELSRELAERRAAMSMLSDWAAAESAPVRPRLTLGTSLRLGLAAAAAAAAVAVPLGLYRSAGTTPPTNEVNKVKVVPRTGKLTMRSMSEGVEVREEADGVTELVVDPFPMKWRTLKSGVQVIHGKSGGPDELVVDPFPEEG